MPGPLPGHEPAGALNGDEEPPDADNEGPSFAEMDPTGRYGRFTDVLGRGACKVVYKAFDTQEGTEVAWNQVRLADLISAKDVAKEERDRMFAEIRVLKALKHKNIMSFYDSWFDAKSMRVNFITELFTSGTLRQYRKRHKHVDSEVLKRWAWQILCGLVYLHGHNPPIIHRDLKCDNIFINGSDGVVKIGDLGLATMLRSRTAPQSVLGTPEFMAPELYEEDYDDRVDVYSFGMALLELATLEYPYAECTNAAQIYRKVTLGVRPQGLQKVTPPDLAEFINICIAPRNQRPRARQLLKHPYFDSVRAGLAPCRSEVSLMAAAPGGTAGVDAAKALPYEGVSPSGEGALAAAAEAGSAGGPPSVGSASSAGGPSRTVSGVPPEALAEARGSSDAASLPSQRSTGSELAAALTGMEVGGAVGAPGPGPSPFAVGAAAGDTGSRMGSRAGSRAGSPPGSPAAAVPGGLAAAPAGSAPGSAAGSDQDEVPTARCAATERCFRVAGRVRADDTDADRTLLNLRLRIGEPDGTTRTVEFEFDLTHDTVGAVASEMVSDLELTPEDADVITSAMMGEIAKLSAKMEGEASMCLENAAAALQAGLMENALLQANSTTAGEGDGGAAAVAGAGTPGGGEPTAEQPVPLSVAPALSPWPSPPPAVSPLSAPSPPPARADSAGSEQWEEAVGRLPSALSTSSLVSEASVASAHSVHSAHSGTSAYSIQSSPAQLAVPKDAPAGRSTATGGSGSAGPSPPQASQRLARTVSVDRNFRGLNGAPGPGSAPQAGGAAGQRPQQTDRLSPRLSIDRAGSSGVLSPVSSVGALDRDKRSLSKLFENLLEVANERSEEPPARCVTPPPSLGGGVNGTRPPLPRAANGHANGHRLSSMRSSPPSVFSTLIGVDAGTGAATGATVNGSAVSAPGPSSFDGDASGSNGSSSGLLASSVSLPAPAPGSELMIAAARPATRGAGKDKETLRKQAADAMKAVELRSLTLLQGSMGGPKATRGTPMAATRNGAGSVSNASLASSNGGAAPASSTNGTMTPPEQAPTPPAEPVP